jgi:hypothetical protein
MRVPCTPSKPCFLFPYKPNSNPHLAFVVALTVVSASHLFSTVLITLANNHLFSNVLKMSAEEIEMNYLHIIAIFFACYD